MFDIGWTELMVVGVVALIVIGPKDLPDMFRTMGRFTAQARSMARDFQRAMEAAADEAGVKDVAKDLKNVTSARSMGLDAVKNAASKFEKWDPMKPAPKPAAPAPVAAAAAPAAADAKPAAPMGPATQALADAQAAKRAALAEPVQTILRPDPEAAAPAAKTPRKSKADKAEAPAVAPKPKPKPKAATTATASKAAAEPTVAAKPARKAKKPDAGKTQA
jgi:sec-independent protein translocase protein TatB